MKMVALVSLLICALLLTACGAREPDGSDRETLPKESYVTVTDEGVTHRGGLDKADFSADSAAGEKSALKSTSLPILPRGSG